MNSDDWKKIILCLSLVTLLILGNFIFSITDSLKNFSAYQPTPPKETLLMIQESAIKAAIPPSRFTPPVLGIAVGTPLTYRTIISCIAFHESSNNHNAINYEDPNGGSFGLLQFQLTTFKEFCVDRYNFSDNIFDPDIQRYCADEMLKESWNYIYRWSTYKHCI